MRIPFHSFKLPSQYDDQKPPKSPRFWRRAFMGLSFSYLFLGILIVANILVMTLLGKAADQIKHCRDFSTQAEAQKAYDNDPVKYSRLDGWDNDKKVCENI